jgi:hypothetical protein
MHVQQNDPIAAKRIAHASRVFSSHGLAPRFIAEGDRFYIDEAEKKGVMDSSVTAEDVGKLVARIHKIPIDWHKSIKE